MDDNLERRDSTPPEDADDGTLIRRARSGCVTSFGTLVDRHGGALLHYLMQRTGNRQDAEDVAQEAWLRAWRYLERVDERRSFRPWLFTVAARLAVSHRRRQRAGVGLDGDILETLVAPVPAAVDGRDDVAELWKLAARLLSSRQREALWLFYMEGMTVEEVAAVMRAPRGLVKVWLHRARTRLARRLGGRRPEGCNR